MKCYRWIWFTENDWGIKEQKKKKFLAIVKYMKAVAFNPLYPLQTTHKKSKVYATKGEKIVKIIKCKNEWLFWMVLNVSFSVCSRHIFFCSLECRLKTGRSKMSREGKEKNCWKMKMYWIFMLSHMEYK